MCYVQVFGRRPPARMDSLAIPASENLHISDVALACSGRADIGIQWL
jgi:hypothetical protein